MNFLKGLAAAAALAVIVIAFRDVERGRWLAPALPGDDVLEDDDTEPVLGYDGMDVDTLLEWLAEARLDGETLARMHAYEESHHGREAVLDAIEDALG